MKNRLLAEGKLLGLTALIFLISTMFLVSCGGGGGGSGPGVTETINKDNVKEIIERINAFVIGEDTAGNFGELLTPEYVCPDGGNVTTQGGFSSPPAVGDTLTVTYDNCQEPGVIRNGSVTITIKDVSASFDGTPTPPYNVTIAYVYNDLSTGDVNLGLIDTTNGDMTLSFSEDLAGNTGLIMQGNSRTVQYENVVETLSDFYMELNYNYNTGDNSLNMNATLDSTLIGDPVSFITTTPFTGNDNIGTGNPTAGVLHITTSVDNSQALLTALPDGVSLEIRVDADGNGAYEYVDSILWSDLE
jgi:hypothetical protein